VRSNNELLSEEESRIFRNFRESPERRYFIEKFWTEIAGEIASQIA
jgi:hypothetical protein